MAQRFCSKCGAKLMENARFCTSCRQPVEQTAPRPQASAAPRPTNAPAAVQPAVRAVSAAQPAARAAAAARSAQAVRGVSLRAPRKAGKIIAGSFGDMPSAASAVKSRLRPSVIIGGGLTGLAAAVGLYFVPHGMIVSAAVGVLSLIKIIFTKVRGGRRK